MLSMRTPGRCTGIWVLAHLAFPAAVGSFPTGAGSCIGGQAAVSGSHLDFGPGSPSRRVGGFGTLAEGNVTLRLGGSSVRADSTVTVLSIGKDVSWTLSAGKLPIRGFLVRVQAPGGVETAAAITCGVNQTLSSTCAPPIIGCTHTERSDKFNVTGGSLRFDNVTRGVKVDVTVVFQNNFAVSGSTDTPASLYAYSSFNVDFLSDGSGSGGFAAFFAVLRQIILLIIGIFGGGTT